MQEPKTIKTSNWPILWAAILLPLILLTFFFQFTFPIHDGDLWWQMAYGRYFIENQTLIADHSIFTWSKVDNTTIYCAWLAEIFLYLLYKAGNLPALFILRYICMSTFIIILWLFARKIQVHRHPLTWFICLLGILMSVNASRVKPEIFSYVLICLAVANWMFIKTSGEKVWKFCYFFPLIMLIWVNSHGGFIFGAVFLLMMGIGEEMNALYSRNIALPRRVRQHLFIALCLSALAILSTPYGIEYPINLLKYFLQFNPQHYAAVMDYGSIFGQGKKIFHFVDYLIVGSVLYFTLIIPRIIKAQFDWAVLLANALTIFLYVKYTRSTYFWAPVFGLTSLHLLSLRPGFIWPETRQLQLGLGIVIIFICLFISGRAVYKPPMGRTLGSWTGYGISYINPVEETEFIQSHLSNYRIGNDYNTGGYLIWKLASEKKIFIDPRYFPFRNWYSEYRLFANGVNVQAFLEKNPADAWCIIHHYKLRSWFAESPDWKLAFFGPSASVFVRSDIELPDDAPLSGQGINDIKNLYQAQSVLKFATEIKSWDNAKQILTGMRSHFRSKKQIEIIDSWQDLLDGFFAYHQRNYKKAAKHLKAAKNKKIVWSDKVLINSLLLSAVEHWDDKDSMSARQTIKTAMEINPQNALVVYNMGVIEWYMSNMQNLSKEGFKYEEYLKNFLEGSKNLKAIPPICRQIAQAILNGQYGKQPPLLKPQPPAKYEPVTVKPKYNEISLLPAGW